MAFDVFEIFRIILQSLQGISILIIIFGMVSAFLWKVAFYIQLALGLILTVIATYFVYSFTQAFRLPATWAILIFIIGIIASLIQAARAAVMAIVNGFFLTWLGTLLFLAMGQALDPIRLITHLGGTIIISAIIAMILVAIAAYAGGHLTSIFRFPKLTRQKTYKSDYEEKPRPYSSNSQRSSRPSYAEHRSQESRRSNTLSADPEEEIRITLLQNPSASQCGICEEEWLIDSEIFRCPKCGTNFHSDCIKEYLNREHCCPKCLARARLSLN